MPEGWGKIPVMVLQQKGIPGTAEKAPRFSYAFSKRE
jgi:hypothetical protein